MTPALALSELRQVNSWAILPESLKTMDEVLTAASANGAEANLRVGRPGPRSSLSAGGVAVLPIYGPISHRETLWSQIFGGTSTQRFSAMLQQAISDPSVGSIVLDVDSPGGAIDGVDELSAEIYRARGKKKMVAIANTIAASAAYWIASAADEIVITRSGMVGSIGVFCTHADISEALDRSGIKVTTISAGKYKTEGNECEPLSDQARASIQGMVNGFYDMFVAGVARNRGASQAAVRDGYGQGRMVAAQDAVKMRMADRVATIDDTLGRLLAGRALTGSSASASLETRQRERQLELLREGSPQARRGWEESLRKRQIELLDMQR